MAEDAAAGGGPPLSMRLARGPSLGADLTRAFAWLQSQGDIQAGRGGLWAPVALGCGAAIYFALPKEPVFPVAVFCLLGALGLGLFGRSQRAGALTSRLVILAACLLAGLGLARWRTEAVRAPVAPPGGRVLQVEAWVVDVVSPGQGGSRVLLAPVRISGLAAARTPIRIRLTLRGEGPPPAPGQRIQVAALLNPPPPPSSPGAYDFARDAFFDGVGGVGLALGEVRAEEGAQSGLPIALRLQMAVNAFRWNLTRRLVDRMGPETGGLAAAMSTGHEAFVPESQVEALRTSGLAHIISISGLHMAIVGGFVFGLVRGMMACLPALALRMSGRKAAAIAGTIAVLAYLVLSGAPDPAVRAAVTACAAFFAILTDRRAISLRTLALAAMIVLVLRPEAVTQPGFQMSFAATAALVALAESWPSPVREISAPLIVRAFQGAGVALVGGLAISLAAGLATGPFALQHFNRVAVYGLPANLLTEPISTLLLMPSLALGVVLAPLDLAGLPLWVAAKAIAVLNAIATFFAGLPGAERVIASAPPWTLPVTFLGLLVICLWRGPLRWLGLPLALTIYLVPRTPPPDLWVAHDAASAAIRQGAASIFLRPDVRRFGAEVWARRRGLELAAEPASGAADQLCGPYACQAGVGDLPVAVIWTRRPAVLAREFRTACASADLIILRGRRPEGPCRSSVVLDQADFETGGALELWRRRDGGWDALWAQPIRGDRPWSASTSQ